MIKNIKKIALMMSLCLSTIAVAQATTLERDEKAVLVRNELRNQLGADDVNVVLDASELSTDIPAAHPTYLLESVTTDVARKRFQAMLTIKGDTGSALKVLEFGGQYSPMVRIPVLNGNVAAKTVLNEDNLTTQTIAEDKINNRTITDKSKLLGMATRRPLMAQRALTEGDIEAPKIIKKGESISMKVTTPFMQLSMQGRALEDGAMGDSIRVLNISSKKTIDGVVMAAGIVEVPTSLGEKAQVVMQALQQDSKNTLR